jgi:hypothetical protein
MTEKFGKALLVALVCSTLMMSGSRQSNALRVEKIVSLRRQQHRELAPPPRRKCVLPWFQSEISEW